MPQLGQNWVGSWRPGKTLTGKNKSGKCASILMTSSEQMNKECKMKDILWNHQVESRGSEQVYISIFCLNLKEFSHDS